MKKILMLLAIAVAMLVPAKAAAQYATGDVRLDSESGSQATFVSTCSAKKAGDAVNEALEGTFNVIFTQGVEGLHSGQPMIDGDAKSFLYRFFNEKLYNRFLAGAPVKESEQKINKEKQVTIRVTVRMDGLLKAVKTGGARLNPAWADKTEIKPTSTINPSVIVTPYVRGDGDDGFQTMKAIMDSSPVKSYAVGEVSSIFAKNGYKTRDLRTALSNSKTSALLGEDGQDDKTLAVRELPGDIVVSVDVDVQTDGQKTSSCTVNLRAVENQTENTLGSVSYASGRYMTTDSTLLVKDALKRVQKEFFSEIQAAFERMVSEGRRMNLEFNVSSEVADWDFASPTPATDNEFMDALEDWLSENSFQGVYDMGQSTDRYISASINIPVWDSKRNRGYTTSRFSSDLKKFLRKELGDSYKPEVTSMGQKLLITIK